MAAAIDNGRPWLSVLVPAYNVDAYIEACMRSVLTQADGGVELIVLDDNSGDDTWDAMLRGGQTRDGHARLLHAEQNRGVSAARNRLLDEAKGSYIWFVDADDVVESGAIAELREVINRQDPDLVMCDFRYLQDARHSRRRSSFAGAVGRLSHDRASLIAGLMEAGELHVWTKIARREIWRQARFPEGRYFEDIAVSLPLMLATQSYIHLPRPWIGYRRHPASIMATIDPAKLRQWIDSMCELLDGLHRDPAASTPKARYAMDDFALRNFTSILRRVARLADATADLHGQLAGANAVLFPHGARAILRRWRRRGWWLRAWRAERALRSAGFA